MADTSGKKYIVKRMDKPFGGLSWAVYEVLEHGNTLRALAESKSLAEHIVDMLRDG